MIPGKLTSRDHRKFQEGLLSTRLLMFTEHQTLFYYVSSRWEEGRGTIDSDSILQHQTNAHHDFEGFYDSIAPLRSSEWDWKELPNLLNHYSKRKITKKADTLDAFLGIMNHLRRSRPTAHHLCGLPFFKQPGKQSITSQWDLLEGTVTAALAWHAPAWHAPEFFSSSCHERRSTFPSWTWAGWSGPVTFWRATINDRIFRSCLRHTHLESTSGKLVMSSTLHEESVQRELDTVTLIQFEVHEIPSISFSVTHDGLEISGFLVTEPQLTHVDSNTASINAWCRDHLHEGVCRGIWSCLTLCCGLHHGEMYESIFVLVVCWKADQVTAERVGSFVLRPHRSALEPLGEDWVWRRVRLI